MDKGIKSDGTYKFIYELIIVVKVIASNITLD